MAETDLLLAHVAWRGWVSVLQLLHPPASLSVSVSGTKPWEDGWVWPPQAPPQPCLHLALNIIIDLNYLTQAHQIHNSTRSAPLRCAGWNPSKEKSITGSALPQNQQKQPETFASTVTLGSFGVFCFFPSWTSWEWMFFALVASYHRKTSCPLSHQEPVGARLGSPAGHSTCKIHEALCASQALVQPSWAGNGSGTSQTISSPQLPKGSPHSEARQDRWNPFSPKCTSQRRDLFLRAKKAELLPFILIVSMETIKLSYAVTYCNII